MKNAIGRFGLFSAAVLSLVLFPASLTLAQTTEFIHQGKLPNSITPSTDIYEMEFKLFDTLTDGSQIGSTNVVSNVEVKNRAFTVKLDFGASAFPGADRFLEVSVRLQNTDGPFTVISPREQVLSVPYAIRALDATHVGGIDPNNFVLIDDPRLTDARDPTPGSSFYIQNTTALQTANFRISGNGRIGGTLFSSIVDAATQYNINGNRILGTTGLGNSNLFAGVGAGEANTSGFFNSFFGNNAGASNTTGSQNSFFGFAAGQANIVGVENSFFGRSAGASNNTGGGNSFFGSFAGTSNINGNSNTYFGARAGKTNTGGSANSSFGSQAGENNTASNNSFFGSNAGTANTLGFGNSFFGSFAGKSNTTGDHNSFFGIFAGSANIEGDANSFFGSDAGSHNTGSSNSFFGFAAGASNTISGLNSFFGSSAGGLNTGGSNSFFGGNAGLSNTTGSNNTLIGTASDVGAGNLSNVTAVGAGATVAASHSTAIGAGSSVVFPNTIALGRMSGADNVLIYGLLQVQNLGSAGANPLCWNASNLIATCSSSLRYKAGVQSFTSGLDVVSRLRPISFSWKDGGMRDVGFGAEDVEKIEPLLVTRNANGQVESVKYEQITTVLVNAVQQQQTQIEAQQKQLKQQQQQISALKKFVCQSNPQTELCKE